MRSLNQEWCPGGYIIDYARDDEGSIQIVNGKEHWTCTPDPSMRGVIEAGFSPTFEVATPVGTVMVDGTPAEYVPQAAVAVGSLIVLYLSIKLINKLVK